MIVGSMQKLNASTTMTAATNAANMNLLSAAGTAPGLVDTG